MTHFSNRITEQGPILIAAIGPSRPKMEALQKAGITPPPLMRASLLIDTGASHSCICSSIIAGLSLVPTGVIEVHTPTTGTEAVQVGTYDIGLVINGLTPQDIHVVPSLSVTENNFAAQGIHGLLGRDILSHAHLFYNGVENVYFLSF